MITKDMDTKVSAFNRQRRVEKRGRRIYVQQLNGNKVSGRLVQHKPNIFVIESDDGILKEIHRATVVRFMIVIEGGKSANRD